MAVASEHGIEYDMSTQKTLIKILKSETFASASKAARNAMANALKGGDKVDAYFQLRSQAGELLNGIRNNKGFEEVARDGLYKDQNALFYSEGNSDLLASMGIDNETYNESLFEEHKYSSFLAFQLGKGSGSLANFEIESEGHSGPAASFKWCDLGPLVLNSCGRAAVQSYATVIEYLRNADKPTASKAWKRAMAGADFGIDADKELTTPNGNQVHFSLANASKDALTGLAEATCAAAVQAAQSMATHGISFALIVQNHTGKDIDLNLSFVHSETELVLSPGGKKSTRLPACVESGEETGIDDFEADRHLAGEVQMLFQSKKEDGRIGFTLELDIDGTPHKLVTGFDGPVLDANSSIMLWNPSGSGKDIYEAEKGKNKELSRSSSHDDFGVTLAINNNTEKTIDTKTGKEGYFYRAVMAIYDKTSPPKSWGRSPLDGLLFGSKY